MKKSVLSAFGGLALLGMSASVSAATILFDDTYPNDPSKLQNGTVTITGSTIGSRQVKGENIDFYIIKTADNSIPLLDCNGCKMTFDWNESTGSGNFDIKGITSVTGTSSVSLLSGAFGSAFIPFGTSFIGDAISSSMDSGLASYFSISSTGESGVSEISFAGVDGLNADASYNPVPVPAAAWLFGSALLGLVGVARRRSSNA